MIPSQQTSSSPTLSPNKSIKQRQRQRTLNEQLDLLDKQFCVEVDVQMANRVGSISVSTPKSKDIYNQRAVNKMFSKSLDGVFHPSYDLSQSPYSPPTKTSRIQNFFRYYSPNPVTQHQPLHKSHGGKCSPIDFSSSARPLMSQIGCAQQSKSISDFGPSSFGSRIVLIPSTTESTIASKTALLIKNEVNYYTK